MSTNTMLRSDVMKKKTVIALSCLLLAFTPTGLFAEDDVMAKAKNF